MIRMLFFIAFFVFILMFLAGFSVFRTLKNIFYGDGKNQKTTSQRRQNTRTATNNPNSRQQEYTPTPKKKIFSDDEGEYVEYEEVKEKE